MNAPRTNCIRELLPLSSPQMGKLLHPRHPSRTGPTGMERGKRCKVGQKCRNDTVDSSPHLFNSEWTFGSLFCHGLCGRNQGPAQPCTRHDRCRGRFWLRDSIRLKTQYNKSLVHSLKPHLKAALCFSKMEESTRYRKSD